MHVRLIFYSVLTALLLLGCSKQQESKTATPNIPPAIENVAEVVSVEKRENRAPNFSWKDQSDHTMNLDTFRGKATLVNFWATWCGPCKRELPDLVALHTELASHGIKIVGISTDRGSNAVDDVRSFVRDHGIQYQIVIASEELEEAFGNVRLLPTSFILDADGNIVQTIIGPRSKAFFSEALLAVAK